MSPFKIILNAIMSFKHGQEIVKFKAKKTLLFSHIGHCSCGINPIFFWGGGERMMEGLKALRRESERRGEESRRVRCALAGLGPWKLLR